MYFRTRTFAFLFFLIMVSFLVGGDLGCKSGQKDDKKSSVQKNQRKKRLVQLDKIRYIVLEEAITQYDISAYTKFLRSRGEKGNLRKKAEKLLVEKVLVYNETKKKSIVISPDRLNAEIQSRQRASGLKGKQFRARMEKESGLSYEGWKEAIEYEICRRA